VRAKDLPLRLCRTALILVAAWVCLAAATPVAAQQVPDSARATATNPAPAPSASAALPGPRVAPARFQAYRPSWTRNDAALGSSAAGGAAGGRPIVISTLALVLIIIIVVLLVR